MPRFKVRRPTQIEAAHPQLYLPLDERRRRAFARVWPLLSTSIPTADILASYLDELVP